MKAGSVLAPIGNTPHMRVHRLFGAACQAHQIYVKYIKSERSNPGGSIKDRSERDLSVEGFLP